MDMEDGSHISDTSGSEVINAEKDSRPSDGVHTTGGTFDNCIFLLSF